MLMSQSEQVTPTAQGGKPSLRQMNEQMVQRLLAQQADAIADGGYGLRVLEHTGRDSAHLHRTPIGVLLRAGCSYLVCPDRTRDWPRNLLAAPRCVIHGGVQRDERCAHPIDGDEGIDVVTHYVSVVQAPWALRAFGLSDDPARDEVARAMPRMIVFRLEKPSHSHPVNSPTRQLEQEH